MEATTHAGHSEVLRHPHQDVLQPIGTRVPHFHAIYGEFNAVFAIESLEMLEGDLPVRAQRLVRDWAATYQKELRDMWDRQEFRQLPGLE